MLDYYMPKYFSVKAKSGPAKFYLAHNYINKSKKHKPPNDGIQTVFPCIRNNETKIR